MIEWLVCSDRVYSVFFFIMVLLKWINIGFYFCYYFDRNIVYSIYIIVCLMLLIFLILEKEIYINGCMFNILILMNKRENKYKIFLSNII